jgi:hypothetical protein
VVGAVSIKKLKKIKKKKFLPLTDHPTDEPD